MENYRIQRVNTAPDWSQIPSLKVTHYQWLPSLNVFMEARLCHDGQKLYVQLRAQEENIRAEHQSLLCRVCEDSCMEFFFCPIADDLRYFNFEINPNAAMYIGIGHGKADLVRLLPHPEQFETRTERIPGGWQAEYVIPADFVRLFFPEFALESGRHIRANLYKCGEKTLQPHYISWNEIDSDVPNFHRPQAFGEMILD